MDITRITQADLAQMDDAELEVVDMDSEPWTPERRQWMIDISYDFLAREGHRVLPHFKKAFDSFLAEEIGGNELLRRLEAPFRH